jgi:hypothetical protein
MQMETWIAIVVSVDRISSSLPLRFISWPFHDDRRSATLSISGCHADLGSFPTERAAYLIGKAPTWQGNASTAMRVCCSEHHMGIIWHLAMLQTRPDAPLNMLNISRRASRSQASGLVSDEQNEIVGIEGGLMSNATHSQVLQQLALNWPCEGG